MRLCRLVEEGRVVVASAGKTLIRRGPNRTEEETLDEQPPIQFSHTSPHELSSGVGGLDAVRPGPVSQ